MPPPDKRLFTPGPLTTSLTVKEAMLRDVGSRDPEFIALVRGIRRQLLALAGVSQELGYEAVLIQGSGTFGVESVLSTAIPRNGRLLVVVNGAYGDRMVQIAKRQGLANEVLRTPENIPADPSAVRQRLSQTPEVTHVAVVHCETTTGILNPVEAIGQVVRESGKILIVDAMSSFGAIPLKLAEAGIDFLVSSPNKCIEGVPGFSFVLARRGKLAACAGNAPSLSLDLHEQWKGLEANGQFRFTPPTHAILACYKANHQTLLSGMQQLGFRPFLDSATQSDIITAFHYPGDPRFQFEDFYTRLSHRGMVIYPGKLGSVDCFRIGNIGRLYERDIRALLDAVTAVLSEMNVAVPMAAPRDR
jgi:2-aminoethylphosphonate-pyruvate transaminase